MNALLFCQPSRSNFFLTFLPALAKLWEVFVFVSVFVCCVVFVSNCLSIYLVTFLPALSRICVSKDVFVFASVFAFVLFCQQLPLSTWWPSCPPCHVFVFLKMYLYLLRCLRLYCSVNNCLYLPGDLLARLGQHIEPLLSANQAITICVSPAKFWTSSQVRFFLNQSVAHGTWSKYLD